MFRCSTTGVRCSPLPTAETGGLSFLGGDPVCNLVIFGLRHDAPCHHFAGFVIGTPRNHSVCFCRSHARQAQQLVFCSSVQVEWLFAASSLLFPFPHPLGLA